MKRLRSFTGKSGGVDEVRPPFLTSKLPAVDRALEIRNREGLEKSHGLIHRGVFLNWVRRLTMSTSTKDSDLPTKYTVVF